ncbi:hypothetical protein OCK74_18770 [Chitinophagaceae bacterium LB-8]|uniref:Uncharacterized protein n=1 Tax=Paraflavisolibacter caeni TaxID=2982496 RepID=A0A9X2XXI5_9BACT|nr:hypothetical protein [Paraflavisolibacter caeni]MCU7551171.1 hypothetical protein [Paraflavisolibacter caeni]
MKTKHAITLLVLGYCLDLIGAFQKLMHHPQAGTIFIVAACLKVLGALLFFYKLLTYPKFKDFFNW